jgi:drug/metabolite transporter (DMT)-like permease
MMQRFVSQDLMPNSALYLLTIFIWGTSWYVIKLQLGEVAPQVSVFYRFVIAALTLLIYCLIRRKSLHYGLIDHARFAFIGLFLFNLNYISIYFASFHLTTGLISVIFSCVQIFNMVIGYLVLRDRITGMMLVGALTGILGIGLVFSPEINQLDWSSATIRGIGLALVGTLCAAIGMISSARFQRQQYPVLQTNAWGMAWGALWMGIYIWIAGIEFSFEYSAQYIGGLFWLSIFSTVFGFGCFLTLVGRIGAARSSYAMVIFPIVALALSTLFEGYQWTTVASIGLILAIAGNIIILLDKQQIKADSASVHTNHKRSMDLS